MGPTFFFLSTRLLNGAYWTSTAVNNHCLCTQAWRREARGPLKDKQSRENIYDRLLNYKWWLKTLSMWQQTNQGLKSTQNCDDHQILIPHTGTTLGGSATIYFLRFRLARGQSTFWHKRGDLPVKYMVWKRAYSLSSLLHSNFIDLFIFFYSMVCSNPNTC